MIKVKFHHFQNGSLKGFCVEGHSGSAECGSDIVCAAVSSAAYMTANTILEIKSVNADVEVDDGLMDLTIPFEDAIKAEDILKGFELHIQQLREQYPAHITIITEV